MGSVVMINSPQVGKTKKNMKLTNLMPLCFLHKSQLSSYEALFENNECLFERFPPSLYYFSIENFVNSSLMF